MESFRRADLRAQASFGGKHELDDATSASLFSAVADSIGKGTLKVHTAAKDGASTVAGFFRCGAAAGRTQRGRGEVSAWRHASPCVVGGRGGRRRPWPAAPACCCSAGASSHASILIDTRSLPRRGLADFVTGTGEAPAPPPPEAVASSGDSLLSVEPSEASSVQHSEASGVQRSGLSATYRVDYQARAAGGLAGGSRLARP